MGTDNTQQRVCVVCVCLGLCISLLMGAWNRSKARRPVVRRSSMSYPQPFDHLHPAWCVCQRYGCMHVWFLSTCSSFPQRPPSRLAGHLSVIHLVPLCCWGEKLIPGEADPKIWRVSKWCHGKNGVLNTHMYIWRETSVHQCIRDMYTCTTVVMYTASSPQSGRMDTLLISLLCSRH